MNRRDNGLQASSYVRLRDVETHVVEGLLERLREEEVAAYVAPASGRRGPYGDTVLPESPSDSVYVDVERREHARSVVERYLAEVRDELAWAGIVATFDSPIIDVVRRWPASEEVDEPRGSIGTTRADGDEPAAPRVLDWPPAPPPEVHRAGDEEHFQPPPPPPIPVPDTLGRFAWTAVLGGPLFLLVATLAGLDASGWPGLLALGAFMGGFVTLVARMKDRPPSDLGDDDGAVV
ncbi:MAG: hypothetical protein QOI54_3531 [Actinomycetota bacterium]|jgi:hypothetical protein|nr:hypothetical protein [Actinomycetota bacterium]